MDTIYREFSSGCDVYISSTHNAHIATLMFYVFLYCCIRSSFIWRFCCHVSKCLAALLACTNTKHHQTHKLTALKRDVNKFSFHSWNFIWWNEQRGMDMKWRNSYEVRIRMKKFMREWCWKWRKIQIEEFSEQLACTVHTTSQMASRVRLKSRISQHDKGQHEKDGEKPDNGSFNCHQFSS